MFAQIARGLAETGPPRAALRPAAEWARAGDGSNPQRLADYGDDIGSAVRWLAKRDDVDKRRIVVAGYGDGGRGWR